MKKVININFQGRVIPIEESAYDMLTKYVESLRQFFANEEGRDEIINDIEGRIAELFGEILKKGNTCISDEDVQKVVNSMGRPEDFEAEEANVKTQLNDKKNNEEKGYNYQHTTGAKKLYRDEAHKVLGGVCSGIANYFGIDSLVVRILFIIFAGITFPVYLILWIAIPATSSLVVGSQRKRLFRDPDTKLLGGVCSGLAQYFAVQVWIPRLLFIIPFLSIAFRWGHWGWWDFPNFLSFSFSPGSLVIYIIFWLVLPEAKTTAEKLEMKGEKVDLNNIKSTIQADMEGFKDRAKQFGNEVKDRAQELGENLSKSTSRMAGEAGTAVKRNRSGIGRLIVLIVKVFVYFILGSVLFAIVVSLFAGGVASTGFMAVAYPYVLDGNVEKLAAWGTLIFFIWIPVIAIVTWIVRRLTGKKGNGNIIALVFSGLWILGWVCLINLIVQISGDFKYRNNPEEQNIALANPTVNRLEVTRNFSQKFFEDSWFRLEPFASFDEDSLRIRNIWIRVVKSDNDSFKITQVKMANSFSKADADNITNRIKFSVAQKDTFLLVDQGIKLNKDEKFRNQRVIITIAVPVGKRIYIHDNVAWGDDVRVNLGRNNNFWDWENNEDIKGYHWDHNIEYIMSAKGLEKMYKDKDEDNDNEDENNDNTDRNNAIDDYRKSREQLEKEREKMQKKVEEIDRKLQAPADSTRYRYSQPPTPAAPEQKKSKAVATSEKTQDAPAGMNDTAVMKYAL